MKGNTQTIADGLTFQAVPVSHNDSHLNVFLIKQEESASHVNEKKKKKHTHNRQDEDTLFDKENGGRAIATQERKKTWRVLAEQIDASRYFGVV